MKTTARFRRWLPALLIAGAVIGAVEGRAPAVAAPADRQAEAQAALQEGLELARRPDGREKAVKRLKRADRLTPGGSFAARLALARCYASLGRPGDQVEAAEDALTVAGTPPERVAAKRELALGLARRADGEPRNRSERDLEAADRALREAIEEAGTHAPPVLLYERAVVLLRLERDEEAVALLSEFLRLAPDGELAAKARGYVERPERARLSVLPSFELASAEGEAITDESLAGKVVVLDFWATWCAPCHESLPTLEALHRLGEESGLLTVVSVSDELPRTFKPFAAKNGMDWVLAHDESGDVARQSFGVQSLPTIVLADHEGLVLSRLVGWGPEMGDELLSQARRAVERARAASGSARTAHRPRARRP